MTRPRTAVQRAARQNLDEVLALIKTSKRDTAALVWCLQGLTSTAVVAKAR